MASPFVGLGTVRIELPDGLWWDVKERLNWADRHALKMIWAELTMVNGALAARVRDVSEVDMIDAYVTLLKVASVAWNLPDGNGGIAPLDEAHLRLLDDEIMEPVLQRVNGMYQGRSADEKNA